ncbi:MAG TPA: enoyl-CoA hydratase-related protein [Solirubrobacterales bacterium]|nr:enoyl-CoA hydratase-related protein [Solirubrobacterales bacterium]
MQAKDPEELSQLFAERASSGDLEGLLELYEPNALLINPNGDGDDGKTTRERLASLLAMEPSIVSTDLRVVSTGDVALLSNRWRMSFGHDDAGSAGIEGTSTEVARRQPDGSWRYAIDDPASAGLRPSEPLGEARGDASGFEQLTYEEDGPVARIVLNRPERRNALSMQLSAELTSAVELVQASETIKVVVIGGSGETFCAGDDISEMGRWGNANQIMRRVTAYQRMADMLEELDKVTIAAVDGYAVGGGLEITMACDFVIATRRAIWGMPEVDVGITPGWGGTTRMARLIGRRMTKEINLLGALHPASRAAELGLWNRVVEDDRLDAEVQALVEVVLDKNQQAVRQLKFIVNNGVEADLHTAQGFEALSAGLTGAVNGAWKVDDADQAMGIVSFITNGDQWRDRRSTARDFWTDGPLPLDSGASA